MFFLETDLRRFACLMLVSLGILTNSVCVAGERDEFPEAVSMAAGRLNRSEEKRVLQSLSKPVTLECHDVALNEALQQLSKAIDCEILIELEKLREEGIATDILVSLDLGELTAWQSLHFLLRPLNLDWVAHDGILEVTTKRHADSILVTRVYDVHKLCKWLDPITEGLRTQPRQRIWQQGGVSVGSSGGDRIGGGNQSGAQVGGVGYFSVPVMAIQAGSIGQFGGGGVGEGGGFPGRSDDSVPEKLKSVESFLAAILTACSVSPMVKWVDIDREGGTIKTMQDRLIVSQSYQVQFEIAGILHALERLQEVHMSGATGAAQSIEARRTGYPHKDDAAIYEKLAKPMLLEPEDGELERTLTKIARETGIRIWIDKTALSDEGITTDANLNLRRRMQYLPLGTSLRKYLEPYRLTFVVDEGVLVVTTKTKSDEILTCRFYDIRRIPKFKSTGGGAVGPEARLLNLLLSTTHGIWEEIDGQGGRARIATSGHIAVMQTQKLHSEIAFLIDDLSSDEPENATDVAPELRIYNVADIETANDLLNVLPKMLEQNWDLTLQSVAYLKTLKV